MNAYPETQASGNNWAPSISGTGPGVQQSRPELSWNLHQHPDIFANLEAQMADFAAEHESALKEIRKYFIIPTDHSVTTFLAEHRAIPQLLLEAVPHIKACFGAETVFHLRVRIDDGGSRTLYAVAMWPGALSDVRNSVNRFDDWWVIHSARAFGYLTFTYELV